LNARKVIPNAGPPVFLNPENIIWNQNRRSKSNPFILMDDAVKYLQTKNIPAELLLPGDQIYFDEKNKIHISVDTQKKELVYDNYEQYIKQYEKKLKQRRKQIEKPTDNEVNNIVEKFQKQLKKIKKISKFYVNKINFPVLFDFKNQGKWVLDFNTPECLVHHSDQKCNYSFEIEPKAVALLFREKSVDFEKYFLGCNFKCSRDPDEYNEFLFVMLRHFDIKRFLISEALFAKRSNILQETFRIKHNGETYSVQKYCPHMHANLEKVGYIDGEHFICPLHGWKFNLKNGKCKDKKHFCLNIKKEKT